MVAIQDRITRTLNYRKHFMQDTSIVDDSCRRCRQAIESIDHIIGGCSLIASIAYKERHDNVAKVIHMELAFKNALLEKEKAVPCFLYIPPPVIENEEIILYWDKAVLTDRMVRHNRSDIILVEKQKKKSLIIDIAVPNDSNLRSTIEGKKEKYSELCFELIGLWGIQDLSVVPIVLSNTGVIPKNLFQGLTTLGLPEDLYKSMQMTVILRRELYGSFSLQRNLTCLGLPDISL